MHQIIKNIFIVVLSVGLLSAFSVLAVLWAFSNNLPDYKFLKIINHQFLVKFTQGMVSW